MLFSRFAKYTGPKVYSFKDPDTGYIYNANTKAALIQLIIGYRQQNRLPEIENLHAVVDNYLCNLPENCGACESYTLHRSLFAYMKGGIALLQNLYYGKDNIAPLTTADARAKICISCPLNQFPDRDMFVKWSDDIALATVGDNRSTYHGQLGNCIACSCCLKAKVFFNGKISLSSKEIADIMTANPNCWQLNNIRVKHG